MTHTQAQINYLTAKANYEAISNEYNSMIENLISSGTEEREARRTARTQLNPSMAYGLYTEARNEMIIDGIDKLSKHGFNGEEIKKAIAECTISQNTINKLEEASIRVLFE